MNGSVLPNKKEPTTARITTSNPAKADDVQRAPPTAAPVRGLLLTDVDVVGSSHPIRRFATSGRWSDAINAWRVRGISTLMTSTFPS